MCCQLYNFFPSSITELHHSMEKQSGKIIFLESTELNVERHQMQILITARSLLLQVQKRKTAIY